MRRRTFGTAALVLGVVLGDAACSLLVGAGGLSGAESPPNEAGVQDAPPGDVGDAGDAVTLPPVAIAVNQNRPRSVRVDGTHVYWINANDNQAMRVAKSGGDAGAFGKIQRQDLQFALDTFDVYFFGYADYCAASVWVADKASGNTTPVVACDPNGTDPRGAALDDLALYFTNARSNVVVRVLRQGGQSDLLAAEAAPEAIAVNARALIFSSLATQRITMLPKPLLADGGVTIADNQPGAYGLAADDDSVVWTTTSGVRRYRFVGGTIDDVDHSAGKPIAVALFGGDVFWVDADKGTVRGRRDGDDASFTIASGQTGPSSIAVDRDGIYWTTSDGNVMWLRR